MIGVFLGFLLSIWGVMTILIGLVMFLLLPVISAVSRFKMFSRMFLTLAAIPLRRAAFVVSEHNDIYFKQMSFDSLGFETITIDGDQKDFEDPDNALHYWLGIPFALADEEHGVLFDPRHGALGERKRAISNRGDAPIEASDSEWEDYGVSYWLPAVFQFKKGVYELVDLSAVQQLVDGGERAEYPSRVDAMYQHSRDPLTEGKSSARILLPVIAFGLIFGGIWVLASQIGQPDTTVSYTILPALGGGLAAALPFLGAPDDDDDEEEEESSQGSQIVKRIANVDWAYIVGILLLAGSPLMIMAGLVYGLGPALGGSIIMTLLLGMFILPAFTVLGQASSVIGGGLSKLWFKLGFLGFRRPVMVWTQSKYEIREFDQLDDVDESDVTWYSGFNGLLGFTFEPSPDSWRAEVVSKERLKASAVVADGGRTQTVSKDKQSHIPSGYVPSDEFIRDKYGGFVPKRVRSGSYYLDSGIATNRFANSAIGEKSARRLTEAKEEYGDSNQGLSEMTILKTTMLSGFVAAILGISVFILPTLLS